MILRKEERRTEVEPRSKEARISFPHVDRRRSVFTSTSTPASTQFPVYNLFKARAIPVYITYFCYSISSSILCPSIWHREHQKPAPPSSQQPMKCHRKSYGSRSDRYCVILSNELPPNKCTKTDMLNYSCLQLGSMA